MMLLDEKNKERIVLVCGLALCSLIFISSYLLSTSHRTVYTIEVYRIFEVSHKVRARDGQHFTCVYTYGQGQYFFRGNYSINQESSYSFTYRERGKRWRDLELISYREFDIKERDP